MAAEEAWSNALAEGKVRCVDISGKLSHTPECVDFS